VCAAEAFMDAQFYYPQDFFSAHISIDSEQSKIAETCTKYFTKGVTL